MGAQAGKFDVTHLSGVTCLAVEGDASEVMLLTEDRHGRHTDIAEWVRLTSGKGGFLTSELKAFYPHGDTHGVATWDLRSTIDTLKPLVPFTFQYPSINKNTLSVVIQPLYITTLSYENTIPPSRCDGRPDVLEATLSKLQSDSGFRGTPSEYPGFMLLVPDARASFEVFANRRRYFAIDHQLPLSRISVLSKVGSLFAIEVQDSHGKRHSVWRKRSAFEGLRMSCRSPTLPKLPSDTESCSDHESWLVDVSKKSISDPSLRGLLKIFFGYMSQPLDGFLVQIKKAKSDEKFGISFNNMIVTKVARGGVAERSGIKQGMRIHSIGGKVLQSDVDLEKFFTRKDDSVSIVCSNTQTNREGSSSESICSLGETFDDRSSIKRSFFSNASYAELEECCPTESDVPVVGSIVLLKGYVNVSGKLGVITELSTPHVTVRLFESSGILGNSHATVTLENIVMTHSTSGSTRREATIYMTRSHPSQGFGFTINTQSDIVNIDPGSVASSCGLSVGQRIVCVGFEKQSTRKSILASLSEPSLQISFVVQCQVFELPQTTAS
eukprot:TRINITY_DN31336_c0_g1_i1.p1 TRINITY_DN31336_c0_g1~~TRINITY_DN31336_c0_g1_i1.p1  ORF type:complete len:553 (+),score=76.27 TRINITY_DN31336_c0_g1_i1:72-1730(+)